MRALVLLTLFVSIVALNLQAANAAERTWTIAREVYTAEAELIAIRGDLVYLKIDGKVEEVPIERLSGVDQQYLASLSLAPITPGPMADMPAPAAEMQITHEEMPLPGEPDQPAQGMQELELNAPELAPAYGGEPIRQQALQQQAIPQRAYRVDQYGRVIPPQPGVAANYTAPQGNWGDNVNRDNFNRGNANRNYVNRNGANPNDPRYRRPPQQQGPNNRSANSERDNDDDRPGLFGARARRLERERAAANRGR
jgi:hypothetical protein